MMSFILQILFLTILINILNAQEQLQGISNRDSKYYTNYEVFDPDKKYSVEWIVNWQENRMLFNVVAKATESVLFGLSQIEESRTSDVIIITGRKRILSEDQKHFWKIHSIDHKGGNTYVNLSRRFGSCESGDFLNDRDSFYVIWGYGSSDKTSDIDQSGRSPIYIFDPRVAPRSIQETIFTPGPPPPNVLQKEDVKLWTVSVRHRIAAQSTEYMCTIHKSPSLSKRHHIIGGHPRLETDQARKHTNHIFLFKCSVPPGTSASKLFDRFVNQPGKQCYFGNRPLGQIPTQYCFQLKFGHAIGGTILYLPDHMGIPIGDSSQEFYMTQIHYDNPEQRDDISYVVNFDIFYTDKLRPNNAGILSMGHHVPGSPSILLPPHSTGHNIYGHCGMECTSLMLPEDGINITAVLLHTHSSGTKVHLRHFRDKMELPWISSDDNYKNTYQQYRLLKDEVNVLPNDHLMISCEYDNTWTNGSVVGGFSTKQEMCMSFLIYYHLLPDYGMCRSEIHSKSYMNHYLGVENVTWNYDHLEYVATQPENLNGMTLKEISDGVDWNQELRNELVNDHIFHEQENVCTKFPFATSNQGPIQDGVGVIDGEEDEISFKVNYPKDVEEYVPPNKKC